jgi:TolB protein
VLAGSAVALAGLLSPAGSALAAGTDSGRTPPRDGRIVVVNGAADDRFETMNPDGTGVVPLTQIEGFAQHPMWTPDGKRIVFVVDNEEGVWQLTVVNADGSGLRTIFTDHVEGAQAFTPDVTVDGKRIVFSRCLPDESCDLHSVRFDGTGLTKLTEGGNGDGDFWPEVSPDGQRVVFNRVGNRGITIQAWVMRIDGSQARPVTAPALEAGRPRWLPGTDRVLFTERWQHFGMNIWSVRADGSGLRKLTAVSWPHNANTAVASPSGRRVLYADDSAYPDLIGNDLWVMNPDGSGKRLIKSGRYFHSDWGTGALLPAASAGARRGDSAPRIAPELPAELAPWADALVPHQAGGGGR